MAELVVGVVAKYLVSEALSLATQELSLVYNFKDELESLAEELIFIQALMSDADSKDIHSDAMRFWFRKLRAVAFDTEDALQEYKYEVLRHKVSKGECDPLLRNKELQIKLVDKVRIFFFLIRKLGFHYQMPHKLKDLTSRLKSVKQLGMGYGLRPSQFLTSSEVNLLDQRVLTSPSVNESEIVGRDDDVEKVSQLLLSTNDDHENISAIAIVGMAGLGKTAVAQLVYRSPQVVNHFQKKIWVCVSENFEITRVLNDILQSVSGVHHNLTNKEAIIKELKKTLEGTRYLLVLDDVWNEIQGTWDAMERDLREIGGSSGTKVLVTTRNDAVASVMRASHTHPLSPLSNEDGLALLKRRAFAKGGAIESSELVEIGERLVKRCGGMSLAIKALGSLLYSKKEVSEWLSIERSDIWSSDINSNQVLSSIKLSYNHLSSVSLKQCFAYCSIFPKDTELEREILIQLWMAQGLLNPPEGSNLQMEDLGNNFFHILMWNGLLQEPKYDEYNNISYCKMHDVVHDFASRVSKDYCFAKNIGSDLNDVSAVHISLPGLPGGKIGDLSRGIFSNVRTLYVPSGIVENELLKFTRLRTLILMNDNIIKLPTSIGKLKLLKYIDVAKTQIKALPTSFRRLYNLQTLRIAPRRPTKFFLSTLINLRHIYFDAGLFSSRKQVLVGIKYLFHLQTLSYFYLSAEENSSKIEDLGPLQNLRGRLIILGLDTVKNGEESEKAKISEKTGVQDLELHSNYKSEANMNENDIFEKLRPHSNLKSLKIFEFMGSKFPSWMMRRNDAVLHNLVRLTLENCIFCQQLPPLGHLQHLERLNIEGLDNVKRIGAEFYGCFDRDLFPSCVFPALTSLEIKSMRNLEEWIGPESDHPLMSFVNKAFPCLGELEILNCDKLVKLPSLHRLSSLRSLRIRNLGNLAVLPSMEGLSSLRNLRIENLSNLAEFSSMEGHSSLTKLTIQNLDNLVALASMESLSSLTELTIQDLDNLVALPSMKDLTSLASLRIKNLSKLAEFSSMEGLSSLIELTIQNLDNLVALPSMKHLSLLTSLSIENLGNLAVFPSMEGLSSLTELTIQNLDRLVALPSMKDLTSLTSLRIKNIGNLSMIPSMEGLSSLRSLSIKNLGNLAVFQSVKGVSSLRSLRIANFSSLDEISFMEGLSSLTKLTIQNLPDLGALPSMKYLSSLTSLRIENIGKLAVFPSMEGLSSLMSLSIENLGSLIEFSSMEGLSSLTTLTIQNLDNLAALPSLEGLLSLMNLRIKNLGELDVLPSLEGLSSLTQLQIVNLPKLVALPSMNSLSSLTMLKIENLWTLTKLPSMKGLPSLTTLDIGGFSWELDYFPWPQNTVSSVTTTCLNCGDVQFDFPLLKDLTLNGWPKLTSLPPLHLLHLPSLTRMEIIDFGELKALPEWLGNIRSLHSLSLMECWCLEYMPSKKAMQCLTNLQELNIYGCDKLRDRCARESGAEWHKIAHIPDICIGLEDQN